MKLHRIEAVLPVGASVRIAGHIERPKKFPFGDAFDFEQLLDTVARVSSNSPLMFTLDVPEDAAAATARVLREMADELEGKK